MRTFTLRTFASKYLFLFCFFSFSLLGANVFGQSTWTNGNATGIWNDPANWTPAGVPAGVDVIFDGTSTANCAIDVPINVTSISIDAGYTGTITQNAGQTITIGAGGFTQNEAASTFVGDNADITIGGDGNFTLTAGTFTSTSANLSIEGNFANTGTFNANGGTVIFAVGTVNSNISGVTTFNALVIDKNNVNSTAGGTQITATTTNIASGRLRLTNINAASDFGTFTGAGGTRLEINGGNLGTGWDALGDFSGYMGTLGTFVSYIGGGTYDMPVQVDGTDYQNLNVEDGGIKSFAAGAGAVSVGGNLTIFTNTTLDINNNTVTPSGPGTVIFNTATSTLRTSGANNFNAIATVNPTFGQGVIEFDGTVTQDVPNAIYNDLVFTNGGAANPKQLTGAIGVSGDISIATNTTLDLQTNAIAFAAAPLPRFTFADATSVLEVGSTGNFPFANMENAFTEGTVILDGGGGQNLGGSFIFDDLTIEADVSTTQNITINGDFTMVGITPFNINASTLTFNGGIAPGFGTFTFSGAGSEVIYNAAGPQNIITTTYDNLTLSNSGTKTTLGNITVNATTTTTGTAILDLATNNNTFQTNDLDIQVGSAVNAGDAAITVTGTTDVAGTLNMTTGNGTLITPTMTVLGGGVFDGGDGNVTVSNTLTVDAGGDFTGGAGTMATLDLNDVAVNGTGTFQAGPNNTTVSGTFTMATPGNFDANNGTFTYDGVAAQVIQPLVYNNLSTLGAAKTTTGAGTIDVQGNYNGAAGLTLANTIEFGGAVTLGGAHDFTGGTVIYDQGAAGQQIIDVVSYNNLVLNGGAKTTDGASTIGVSGDFGGPANFTLGGATIQFGGTISYTGTGDFSSGTTVYDAAGAQNVIPTTYQNLTLANTGVKSLTNNTTVTGLLTNSTGGVTFDIAANQLDIQGTFTTGGTYDFDAGTVAYSGNADQNIISTLYNDLILTDGDANGNIKTATAALDINGNITISDGTVFDADNFTHTVAGNWTEVGTGAMDITGNPTITFDGGVTHNITGGANFSVIGNAALTDILAFGAGEAFNIASFNLAVGDCNNSAVITSTAPPTQAVINLAVPQTLNFVDIQNINSTGGFITINSNFGNNNSGNITPDAAAGSKTFYWTGNGADNNWTTTDNWSLISSTGVAAGCYPDAIDESVIFDAGIPGGLTVIVDIGGIDIGNLTWGGTAGIDLQLGNSLNVHGNIVEGAANPFTISGANSLVLTGTTNTTVDLNGATITAGIEVNKAVANSATLVQNVATTETFSLSQGTFITDGYNVTTGIFNSTGANTRTLDLQSGTGGDPILTINNAGTSFDITGAAEPTITLDGTIAGEAIVFTNPGAITMNIGAVAKTFPNVSFTNSTGIIDINAGGSNSQMTFSSISKSAAGGTFNINFNNNLINVIGNTSIADDTNTNIFLSNTAGNTFNGLFTVGNMADFDFAGGQDVDFNGNVLFGTDANVTFSTNRIDANAGFELGNGATVDIQQNNHDFTTFTVNSTNGNPSNVSFTNTNNQDILFTGDFTAGEGAIITVANEVRFEDFIGDNNVRLNLNTVGNESAFTKAVTMGNGSLLDVNGRTNFENTATAFTLHDVDIATGATLEFSNPANGSMNDVTMVAGSTLRLPDGQTTTVNDFIIPNSCTPTALTIRSDVGGVDANLVLATSEVWNGVTVQDINNVNAPGITIDASNNPQAGTNVGITDNIGSNSTYYWTGLGADDNWTTTANWSFSTGGPDAGCFPDDPTHNIVFDGASAVGDVIMTNVRNVGNINWNGAAAVTLILNNNLEVNGSLNTTAAATALTVDAASTGTMLFEGANAATINTLGVTLPSLQLAKTNTTTLEGNLTVTGVLTHTNNAFISDGFDISVGSYISTGGNARTLDIQSGTGGPTIMTINNAGTSFDLTGAVETAINSTGADAINFTAGGAVTMATGTVAKTFPQVSFNSATPTINGTAVMTFEDLSIAAGATLTVNPDIVVSDDFTITGNGSTVNFQNNATLNDIVAGGTDHTINANVVGGNMTIAGAVTFDGNNSNLNVPQNGVTISGAAGLYHDITMAAGTSLVLPESATTTVDRLNVPGGCTPVALTIESSGANGVPFAEIVLANPASFNGATIRDLNNTGAGTMNVVNNVAPAGTNIGNITDLGGTAATYYWIGTGGDDLWNNGNNWSFTSGGTPAGCFPNDFTHDAIFDASSDAGPVNVNVAGLELNNLTWQAPAAGIDLQLNNPILVDGNIDGTPSDFTISGGAAIELVTDAVTPNTTLNLAGLTAYTANLIVNKGAGGNTVTLAGNIDVGGQFTLTRGAFIAAGFNMEFGSLISNGNLDRTFDMSNGGGVNSITITGAGTAFDVSTSGANEPTLNFDANDNIEFTNAGVVTAQLGNQVQTYPNVIFSGSTGATATIQDNGGANNLITFQSLQKTSATGNFNITFNDSRISTVAGGAGFVVNDQNIVVIDVNGNNNDWNGPFTIGDFATVTLAGGDDPDFNAPISFGNNSSWIINVNNVDTNAGGTILFGNDATWTINGNEGQYRGNITAGTGLTWDYNGNPTGDNAFDFQGDVTVGDDFIINLSTAGINEINFSGNFTMGDQVNPGRGTLSVRREFQVDGAFTIGSNTRTTLSLNPAGTSRDFNGASTFGAGATLEVLANIVSFNNATAKDLADVIIRSGATVRFQGTPASADLEVVTLEEDAEIQFAGTVSSGTTTVDAVITPDPCTIPAPAPNARVSSVGGAGNPAEVQFTGAQQDWYYTDVSNITASGAIPVNVINGTGTNNIQVNVYPTDPLAGRTLFWVGGTGDWNDCNNWSLTSGGAPGVFPPTAYDDVIFDNNSFTAAGETVTITADAVVKNFTWQDDADFNGMPVLNLANNLWVYDDFNLAESATLPIVGGASLNLSSLTSDGATNTSNLTFNGAILPGGINFGSQNATVDAGANNNDNGGNGANWTLQDAMTVTGGITLTEGTVVTNTQNVTAAMLTSTGTLTRSLNMTNSAITFTGIGTVVDLREFAYAAVEGAAGIEPTIASAGTETINFTGVGAITLQLGLDTKTLPNLNFVSATNAVVNTGGLTTPGSEVITIGDITKQTSGGQLYINKAGTSTDKTTVLLGTVTAQNNTDFHIEMNDSGANTIASIVAGNNTAFQYTGDQSIVTGNVTFGNNTILDWRDAAIIQGDFTVGDNATQGFPIGDLTASVMQFQGNVTFGDNPVITFEDGVQFLGAANTVNFAAAPAAGGGAISFNTASGTITVEGDLLFGTNTTSNFDGNGTFSGDVTFGGNADFAGGGTIYTFNAAAGAVTSAAGITVDFNGNAAATFTNTGNNNFGGLLDIGSGAATISFANIGNNDFVDIRIGNNRTLAFTPTANGTNTVTGTISTLFVCPTNPITITSSSGIARLDLTAVQTLFRATVSNINASNGAKMNVYQGTDGGSNTNVFFEGDAGLNQRIVYWVGGTNAWSANVLDNWNDFDNAQVVPTNWAAASGGAPGECVPSIYDDVIFDGASGTGAVNYDVIAGPNTYDAEARNFTIDASAGTLTFAGNGDLIVTGNFAANATVTWNGNTHQFDVATSNGSVTFAAVNGTEVSTIDPGTVQFPHAIFDGHAAVDVLAANYPALVNIATAPDPTLYSFTLAGDLTIDSDALAVVINAGIIFFVNGNFDAAGFDINTGNFDTNEVATSGQPRTVNLSTGNFNVFGGNGLITNETVGPKLHSLFVDGLNQDNDGRIIGDLRGGALTLDADETTFNFNVAGINTVVLGDQDFATYGTAYEQTLGDINAVGNTIDLTFVNSLATANHSLGNITLSGNNTDLFVRDIDATIDPIITIGSITTNGGAGTHVIDLDANVVFGDGTASLPATPAQLDPTATPYSGNLDFQTQTEIRFDGNGSNAAGDNAEYVVNGTIDLANNSIVQVTDNGTSFIVHGNVGATTAGNNVTYTLDGLTHTFNGTFTTGLTNIITAPTIGSTTTYNGDVTLGATNTSIYNGDAVIFNENLTTGVNNNFNITNIASNNIFGDDVATDVVDFGAGLTGTLLAAINTFDSHANIQSSGGANVNDLQFYNSTFNGRFEFGYDAARNITATVPPAGVISFFGNASTNFNDHVRFGEQTQVDFNGTSNFNAIFEDDEVGSVTKPQWPDMPDFTTEPDLASAVYYPHNNGVNAQDDIFLQFGPLSVINFNGNVNLNRGDVYFIGSEVLPAIALPIAVATTINIDGVITSTEQTPTTGQKITLGNDALVNFLDNSTGSSFSQIYANIGTDLYFNDNLTTIVDHFRLSRRNEVLLSRNGIFQVTGNPWDGDAGASNTLPAVKNDSYNGLSNGSNEPLNAGGFTARVRCDSWLTITNNEDTGNPLANEYATIRFAEPHFHRWQNVEIAKLRVTSNASTTGPVPGWSAAAGALLRIDGDIELDDVILDDSTTPATGSPDPNATIWKPEPVAPQVLYWIGQAGQPDPNLSDFDAAPQVIVPNSNWTNPWNWVNAPGNQPGSQGCVPNGRDIVIFDAASFGGTTFDNTVNLTATSPAFAGASTAIPANVFYNPYVDNGATAHIVSVDDDRIRIQDMEWIDAVGVGETLLAAEGVNYVANGAMDQTGTMQLAATGIAVDFVFQMRGNFIGGELMNNQYEGFTEFYSTDDFDNTDETTRANTGHYVHNKYNGAAIPENSFKGPVQFESNSTGTGILPNLDPDTDRAWYLRSDLVIRDGGDISTRGTFEVRSGQVFSEQFNTGIPNDYYDITIEGDWLMQQRGVFNEGEGTVIVTGTSSPSNIQTDEDEGAAANADFDEPADDFTVNRNPFYNLIINKTDTDYDVFLQNDATDGLDSHGITVLNNLDVQNGVLRDNSYQIRGNNNGGDLTLSSTATLVIDIGQSDPSAILTLPNIVIQQGEAYIIAGTGATNPNLTSALDLTAIVANLNDGTDAIVLENGGAVIDIIGQVGLTTDVAWFNGAATLSTQNSKIWRTVPNGTANIFPATYVLDDPTIGWVDQLGGGTVSATAGATVYGDIGTNAIAPAGGSPELIISEYIHDPVGNNDAIVIYNNTGAPVNLGTYTLTRYNNDDGQATEFPTYYLNTDVNLDIASNVVYNSGQVQRIRRLSDNADPAVYSGTNQNYGNLYIRNVGNKRLDTGMDIIRPGTAADADPTNNAVDPTDRMNRVRGDLVIADGTSTTDITQLSDNGYQFVFNPTNDIRMGEFTRFTIGEQGAFVPSHFPTLYDRNNVFLTNRVAFNIGNVTQTVGAAHVESEVIYNAGGNNQTAIANDIETSGATAAPQRATDADLLEAQFVAGEITYAHLTFTNPYIVAGVVTGIPLKVINNGDPTAATGGLANPTIVLGDLTINQSNHVFDNGNQIQGTATRAFTMGNNTFLSIGNDANSLFPLNYADADINFVANSTVIYNSTDVAAPIGATQKVRRLSSASANQNYGNLIIRNGNDVRAALAYKDLDIVDPTSTNKNTIIRGDITIEEWAELRDAGYQILGDDQGTFTLDNDAVVRFGGSLSDATFTNYTLTQPTQLPYSPYIPGGFPNINLNETTVPASSKVVFTSDFTGTEWPTVSFNQTQFVFADLDFPNLTITQWTENRQTEKVVAYYEDDYARISLTSSVAITEALEVGVAYASASTAATPPGLGTVTVTVTNQTNGDTETLVLNEVGSSGYFVNTITTSGGAVTVGNNNIEAAVGHSIQVTFAYTTVVNGLNLTASANTVVTNVTSVPTASISQNVSAGTSINITLRDIDLTGTGPLTVEVQNQNSGEVENAVSLVETGPGTGIFTGTLATSNNAGDGGNNDGTLYLQDGDVVEVGTGFLGNSSPALPLTTGVAAAYTFTPPVGIPKDDLTITGELVIALDENNLNQPYAGLPSQFRVKFIDDGNQIVGNDTRNFFMGDSTYLIVGRDEFPTELPHNFTNTNIDFENLSTVVYNAGDGTTAGISQNIRLLSEPGRANGNYGNLVLRTYGTPPLPSDPENLGANLLADTERTTKRLFEDDGGAATSPASANFNANPANAEQEELVVRGFLEIQSNIDLFDNGYQIGAFDNTARFIQRQSTNFYIGEAGQGTTFPDFNYSEVFIDMPLLNETPPSVISQTDVTTGALITPAPALAAAARQTEIIYQADANQTVRNLFDGNVVGPNTDAELNAGGVDDAGALVAPNPGPGSYQQSYPKLTLTGTGTKTTEAGTTDLRIRGDFTINDVEFAIGAANTNVYVDDDWISTGDNGDFNITTASDVHFEGYHSQHISDTPATEDPDDKEQFYSITINNSFNPTFAGPYQFAVHILDNVEVTSGASKGDPLVAAEFIDGHIWPGTIWDGATESTPVNREDFSAYSYFDQSPFIPGSKVPSLNAREVELIFDADAEVDFPTTSIQDANASHSVAPVRKTINNGTSFIFPVGTGSLFRPSGITNNGVARIITSQYFRKDPGLFGFYVDNLYYGPYITNVSKREFWMIEALPSSDNIPDVTAIPSVNPANLQVSLTWDDLATTGNLSGGVNFYQELGVAKWSNDPGNPRWELIYDGVPTPGGLYSPHPVTTTTGGPGPNNNYGTVTSTGVINGFSPYTLANTGAIIANNPLPVTLIDFNAEAVGEAVKLVWQTAAEFNTLNFEIQRSNDGINFETIAVVEAAGNSSTLLDYTSWDNNPPNGTVYYRLKINDADETFEYSKVRAVQFEATREAMFFVYPNPSAGIDLNFDFEIPESEMERLSIYDLTGKPIPFRTIMSNDRTVQVQFTQKLPTGIYVAVMQGKDGSVMKEKFTVK